MWTNLRPSLLQILQIDCDSQAPQAPVVTQVSSSPDLEVERLFKKSIKRHPRPIGLYFFSTAVFNQGLCVAAFTHFFCNCKEFVSTVDLRNGPSAVDPSMGNRSRSVPGLDIKASGIDLFSHEFNPLTELFLLPSNTFVLPRWQTHCAVHQTGFSCVRLT